MDITRRKCGHVVGPDGDVLTLADLPPPDTERWVPRKKARLVAAICGGLISLNDACIRYRLTPEEFASWKDALDDRGLKGLWVTKPRYQRPLLSVSAQSQDFGPPHSRS
jgi:hypothetical protein